MDIVGAESRDLPEILDLVRECTEDMNDAGIDQWNREYPRPNLFASDIESGSLFAMKVEDRIVGIIVLTEDQEEEYNAIDWTDKSGKFIIVHRLAVHPNWQRQGIAGKLMDFSEDFAKKNGYTSIRLDTYSRNPRSLRFFGGRKYERKPGEIFFPECEHPFYCYEMILVR